MTKVKATQEGTCQEQIKAKKCLNTLVDWKWTFLKLPRWTHNLGGGSITLIIISGIKNPREKLCSNQEFFTSLQRSQNINIESELTFSIWSYELRIMAKRMVMS